jgi:hypothetical protein
MIRAPRDERNPIAAIARETRLSRPTVYTILAEQVEVPAS